MSPSPSEVRTARDQANLTQREAGRLVSSSRKAWQAWELGTRNMPKSKYDLFLILTGQRDVTTMVDDARTSVVIDNCPEELLSELVISDSDALEMLIVKLVERAGGAMSLDHIIIALFRESGEIHKRSVLTGKIYRMRKKKLLYSVPKKKAVYSTEPVNGKGGSVDQ